jgi:hypothetical protein
LGGLPSGDEAQVTLRLVYEKSGAPLSQHVVSSTPNACPVTECLKRELARVQSPPLLIDKGSYDLALVLERGTAPRRAGGPIDPLIPNDDAADDEASCVDPEVARLSRAKVREVVGTTYDQLKQCYGRALVRDHNATGRVNFEFVIGQKGEVLSAEARDATLRDCEAINCMLEQFRALSFPAPVGRSVRVIYPLNYLIEQPPVSLR